MKWRLLVAIALSFETFVLGDALDISAFQRSNNYIRLTMDSDTSYYHQVWFTDSLTNSVWSVTGLVSGSVWSNSLGSNNFFYRVVSVPVSSPDDEDDDFLPDTWEMEFGLDGLDDSDSGEDSDYDGFSNLEEYGLDTDPIDPTSSGTNVVYVDDDGSFTGTGSFIDPFPYISWGIRAASTGFRVVVQPGLYDTPEDRNLNIEGKAIQVRSVGGAGLTIIDCKSLGRGFVIEDESINSTIEGFTIKNAINGGIYASNASPTISGCIVRENEGGGAHVWNSSATFENCAFLFNEGGGLYLEDASYVAIHHCVLYGNEDVGLGGEVNCRAALENCVVWNNEIYFEPSRERLDGSDFEDLDLATAVPWAAFGENYTYDSNGYFRIHEEGYLRLQYYESGLINSGHVYQMTVDGIALYDGLLDKPVTVRLQLAGTTYETNYPTSTNLIWNINPTTDADDFILYIITEEGADGDWGDFHFDGLSLLETRSTNFLLDVNNTLVEGGYSGGNNILTNDPKFIYDHYHLRPDSPMINAGITNDIMQDIENDERENNPDLGPDEFTDSDSDGLPDWWETYYIDRYNQGHYSDPAADTDGSSINDLEAGSDNDADSLQNLDEYANGTDPFDSDSDGDGLTDGDEAGTDGTGSDPNDPDSDDDGTSDSDENNNGTDPNDNSGDDDGDGLSNDAEENQGTDPNNADTDGDGVPDNQDPYPTTANCFTQITTTNQIEELPSTSINDGTGNADYKYTVACNPTAPTNAAGVQKVEITGIADDAFIVNGQYEHCWQLKGCLLETWTYDITSEVSDNTNGSFYIDVYDWIDDGWASNHVGFSGTAEITYKIALDPLTLSGDDVVYAGETIQLSVTDGTAPYSWSSSDETIATVDANGLVTTLTNGTATITVSDYYGCEDSLEIQAFHIAIDTATLCSDNGAMQDGVLVLNGTSLSLSLTEGSDPQDNITWEIDPAGSGVTFSDLSEGSTVVLNIGQTPGIYTVRAYANDLPTCGDEITISIGSEQKIISYIADFDANSIDILDVIDEYQEKTGKTISNGRQALLAFALRELSTSANDEPSFSMSGTNFEEFVSAKEYRGYLAIQPVQICDDTDGYQCYLLSEVDYRHGYTPLRAIRSTPTVKYLPGVGEVQCSTAQDSNCITVTILHRFMIGEIGQIISEFLTGIEPPFAWHQIEYEICCDGSSSISTSGSRFPTHILYEQGTNTASQAQSDLITFMFAGGSVDAPGDEFYNNP